MPSRITDQHAAMPGNEEPPIINQRPTDNPPIALIRPKFTYDDTPASVAAKAKRPPARRLTQQEINGLRGRETEYKVLDGAVPGFYIVVSPRGTLSWMVMLSIRKPGGGSQQRSVTFARTDEMTLAQAQGSRAPQNRRTTGHRPKAPKTPVKPQLTVRGLIDRYLEERIDLKRSERTLQHYRQLATSIIKAWGDRDANSLTKPEINEFVYAISRKRQRAYSPAPDSRPLAHSDNILSFLQAVYKRGAKRSWVTHNP